MCIRDRLKSPAGYPTLDVHAAMVRPEDIPMVEEMFQKSPDISAFLLADHGAVSYTHLDVYKRQVTSHRT